MAKQHIVRHSPEQKRAELNQELVRLLSGDGDTDRALLNAQALLTGEPLMLTLSISRVTGRFSFITSIAPGTQEQDVRLLEDAVRVLQKELGEALVKMAEERGKRTADLKNGADAGRKIVG